MIRLETERLLIRDHVAEDLDGLFRLLSDATVMRYIPDLRVADLEGARANLRVAMEEAARPEREKFFFAMVERASGAYVGEIGFTREGDAAAELGYFIHATFWGRGLVAEAARCVVRFAFETAGIRRMRIGCYQANEGSERIMVKLGAVKVREYDGEPFDARESCRRVEYVLEPPLPE